MLAHAIAKFTKQLTKANVINYVDDNRVYFIFHIHAKTGPKVFHGNAIYVDEETFIIGILVSNDEGFMVRDTKFRVDGFIEAIAEVETLIANAYRNGQVDQKELSNRVKAVFESTMNVATVTDEDDETAASSTPSGQPKNTQEIPNKADDETATSSITSGQPKNTQEIPNESKECLDLFKKVFEAAGFKADDLRIVHVHDLIHGNSLPIPVEQEDDPTKSKVEKIKDLREDMEILSTSMEKLHRLMSICPYNEFDAIINRITYTIGILNVGSKDILDRFNKLM